MNLGPHPYQGSAPSLFPQDRSHNLRERPTAGDRWRPLRTARRRWHVDQTWTALSLRTNPAMLHLTLNKGNQDRTKVSITGVLTLQGKLVSRRASVRWNAQGPARLVTAVRREVGITWNWAEAGRGALCAVPAAVILVTVDVSLGMVFAIAMLPVAMLGGPTPAPAAAAAGTGRAGVLRSATRWGRSWACGKWRPWPL